MDLLYSLLYNKSKQMEYQKNNSLLTTVLTERELSYRPTGAVCGISRQCVQRQLRRCVHPRCAVQPLTPPAPRDYVSSLSWRTTAVPPPNCRQQTASITTGQTYSWFLGRVALVQVISSIVIPIFRYRGLSVCLPACRLSHSCTLLQPFDKFTCHLAGTPAGYNDTSYYNGRKVCLSV